MISIKRKSEFTGKINTMELPLTLEEFNAGARRSWKLNPNGGTEHMQNVFPQLNAEQREFLMTGCTPEEWTEMFGEEE